MPVFNVEETAQWCNGEWRGEPPPEIRGVSSDTRTLFPGNLYFPLRGENFDGHEFIEDAFARGACAVVVARERVASLPAGKALLCVDDPLQALGNMARGYRQTLDGTFIGITGSVGKTTVKEMLADILSQQAATSRTFGNWNNDIGLPLSLLAMATEDRFGVFEIGMNRPGELAHLCEILSPQWGVVTTIGPVHMHCFDSVEAVAREKAELVRSIPADGVAVLCRDDVWCDVLVESVVCRVVTVAMTAGKEADYVGRSEGAKGRLVVEERQTGAVFSYEMPLPGEYMMQNALRAIAVAREMNVPAEQVAMALRDYAPPAMRWTRCQVNGVDVINDAYNANPLSMCAVLDTFRGIPCKGRKWLVLGGMRELGRFEEEKHLAVGREVAYGKWAGLIATGKLGGLIADGAESEGMPPDTVVRCPDNHAAAVALRDRAREGDCVLLKASRKEKLEEVLEEWEEGREG